MTQVNEVFELNMTADDPRFEGFAMREAPSILGRESLEDDITPGLIDSEVNPNWQQPSLQTGWTPPKVDGRVSEFNDYPCLDMVFPAFSQRAIEALRDLLDPNGEILSIESDTKTKFFFFNVLTISDALDQEKSECNFWSNPPTTATSIDRFVFCSDRLRDSAIFRIRELPMSVFVTDEFVNRVDSHELHGLQFTKVWPVQTGTNWRLQSEHEEDRQTSLKGNTLVIAVPLDGTLRSRTRMQSFEDEVDQILRLQNLDGEYFGSYEGSDEMNDEFRMFFSCPDANRLLERLHGEIVGLDWPSKITIFKREGTVQDQNASETICLI